MGAWTSVARIVMVGALLGPLAERLTRYEAPSDDDETQAVLGMIRSEIDIFRSFSLWYGYVFFLLRIRI